MAANQKPVYATGYTSHAGRLVRPGERLDGQLPDHAVRSAMEGGVATDVSSRAEEARSAETERQRDVGRQIAARSEKRDHVERERLRDIPKLVQLPDGSYARVEE